ncbi:MAG: FAD-dependent oxidoreductase [Lentisphaeria bacterium]|nr:FAD-dependent oxidoreductase [Lentisphaeria bacterium]
MNIDFDKKYDVAVVGGGIAGVAAAVQAARCGKKTVLIEKTVYCGGLATAGLVYVYLPLCDGNGRQVTFGIAEELLHCSIKYGPGEVPAEWRKERNAPEIKRYRCVFSPAAYILALDEFLEKNNIDVWFDTVVCGVEQDGSKISSVTVCNKSGVGTVSADAFIDATGDAELYRKCHVPCHCGSNMLAVWALEFVRNRKDNGEFCGGLGDEVFIYPHNDNANLQGIDGKKVSDYMLASRRILRERYAGQQESRYERYPLFVPAMPQYRTIWSIDAAWVLKEKDAAADFDDSIGMTGDWRNAGPVWEIPFRSLYTQSGPENLIAAGRCTGADGDAWEITRVIPSAALTGQAAGMAAALALDSGSSIQKTDVAKLQKSLADAGVLLRRSELQHL